MKQILMLILACACVTNIFADERIIFDAKINHQPARLAFDTGAGASIVIFSATAKKFDLKVTPPPPGYKPPPGQVASGWTGNCFMEFGQHSFVTALRVIDIPKYLNFDGDGVIGWPAFKQNILSIDCLAGSINFLTNLPPQLGDWTAYRVITNGDDDTLTLELVGAKSANEVISIDTGSPRGVELSPAKWLAWKTNHLTRASTMNAYYTPSIGVVAKEETWANDINLGSLGLSDVPITEADSSDVSLHSVPGYEATLGFAALKRLDVIVDEIHGRAYLRPKKTPPASYNHNRVGAVFVPENLQTDNLVAQVIIGSPASEADIRDGDVLLKIGDIDCTKWRTNPRVLPLSRFLDDSAGAKLYLTLSRKGKIFQATVTLRNMLPPDEQTPPR